MKSYSLSGALCFFQLLEYFRIALLHREFPRVVDRADVQHSFVRFDEHPLLAHLHNGAGPGAGAVVGKIEESQYPYEEEGYYRYDFD